MLKKFGMNEAKPISTPMGTNGNLDSDASGNMVDQKLYRSMIGSLLYVTASRPDVIFSVCMCAKLKGRTPRVLVNCWEDYLFHGHQRSKIVLHYQPSKLNTYPPVVVVHKYFG
jgi:hypothetical protein